jgi:hypothetical protein
LLKDANRNRLAMRSAAELLGAHARMRAVRLRCSSWRIASTTVTVLPVPGLRKATLTLQLTLERKSMKTYGPKITNGTELGSMPTMSETARSCGGFLAISGLTGVMSGAPGFGKATESGKRMRGCENAVARA